MTKLTIRKQYTNGNPDASFQILSYNGDQCTINWNATWEQVLEASNQASDAGMNMEMEINHVNGGTIVIDTWQ